MRRKKTNMAAWLCALASVGMLSCAYAQDEVSVNGRDTTSSQQAVESGWAGDGQPVFRLAEVLVSGQRYIAGEYVRATSQVGILGEQDVMLLPLSVTTISEKAVEDFINPTDGLAGLLTLVPSISSVGNQAADQLNIRGFNENGRGYTLNGIPGMSAMNRQTINYIDSIDVIEGPSTGITGSNVAASSSSVGGTININSKKALSEPITSVGLNWYSKSAFEQTVDVGRRFGDDERWGVRINAANVEGERGIDHWDLNQKDFYINIDQKTKSSKTNLLVGYVDTDSQGRPQYVRIDRKLDFLPSAPDGSNNLNPEWRRDKYKQYIIALNHEQKLNEHMTAFLNAGHYKQDWYYCLENDSAPTIIDAEGNYTTTFEYYPLIDKNDYIQIGINGDFKTGALNHEYVFGVDRMWRYYGGSWTGIDGTFTGNIYHPDSGSWVKPEGDQKSDAYYANKYRMSGWSLMDTITTDDEKLTVFLGLSGKSYDGDKYNARGEHTGKNSEHAYDISPSYGVNYQFTPAFAAFASHTEQFREGDSVGSGYQNRGEILAPYKTKQNEIGVKVKTGDFFHKLSYFDIKKPNTAERTYDGDSLPTLELSGERRHRGVEYTATGAIDKKWNFIGGMMYLDTEQMTGEMESNGKRVNGVPKWTASAGMEYNANEEFAALFRASYVGSSYIQNERLEVPGYFRFDVGVKYKTQLNDTPVLIRAMCYNVTNKHYWQPNGDTLYIGSPRTFMLSAELKL